jgi:acyl-CoA hydrolase
MALREHLETGTIDLMPDGLSGIPAILSARPRDPLIVASVSPPDRHGSVSLGTNASYCAALRGDARVFAELRGRTVRERAHALIAIAAPAFRDELRAAARRLGYA